jgi:hypothetical protein
MATLTAEILVGSPHPNHDGINPTHYMFLSENSRPAWMLVPENIFQETPEAKITWIPTIENMLEDALLMIAIHVLKEEEIVKLAEKFFTNTKPHWAELYRDISKEDREALYEKCRKIENKYKIILTVFATSTIHSQLAVLEHYKMDVEVCVPVFSRLYSVWTKKTRITGTLK